MRIIKHLKKNNGSALTMVLFMLFMLSVVSIAVIALTSSELSTSVMTSDRSKALQASQAGAEKATQIIDAIVGQSQEEARVEASNKIKTAIDNFKNSGIPTPLSSVIDVSDPTVTKIIDPVQYKAIEEAEYKYQFNSILNDKLADKMKTDSDLELNKPNDISDGKYIYEKIQLKSRGTEIDSIDNVTTSGIVQVDSSLDSNGPSAAITEIEVTSIGEYLSPTNGSTYKRRLIAEFGLLTQPNSTEIPVSYDKLTKVRYNKKPSILSGKALIAQKNILSIDGIVNVTGDTVCFGTIPQLNGNINYEADGYNFGGIIAGINSSSWDKTGWGRFIKYKLTLNDNFLAKRLISNDDNEIKNFFDKNKIGSFNFTGNVATSAYVHTLYGNESSHSNITVDGDIFARSVKIESESNYSDAQFKNVYTYDDLKIDGNNANVNIGEWNVTGKEGLLVGLNEGDAHKPSSAAIVEGDSNLYINGEVYVGGSSLYTDYTNTSTGAYISGMSVQKSDSRPAAAFEIDGNRLNPHNYFHLSDAVGNYTPKGTLDVKNYVDPYNESPLMITGVNGNAFNIIDKAMHLKYIWNAPRNIALNTAPWKEDVEYASYFNTGDIKIKQETGDKIGGFCCGGVAANDTIYGPYNGFTKNRGEYANKSINGKNDYAKQMDLFINQIDINNLNLPNATKVLKDWVDESLFAGSVFNEPISNSNKFIYYNDNSDNSVILTNDSVGDGSDTHTFATNQGSGIVYSEGDIYVMSGVRFHGVLIAEGNIIFIGDSNQSVNITYDEDVIDELILGNPNIGRFFKYTLSDVILNNNAVAQTIKKKGVKNIKIISWKEN